jgi:hypothetical protein
MSMPKVAWSVVACVLVASTLVGAPPGEAPNLGDDRVEQDSIENDELSLQQIRREGLLMFTTPFNKLDGYGDGPMNPVDFVSPGGRPTLQGNGTSLRVNGLDAQTCLECHTIVSNASIPARLGIGGVGGISNAVLFQPTHIGMDNPGNDGEMTFNGRYINPPFLFGAGGVELLGQEMTTELQALKAHALANPGVVVPLVTKGVSFGSIVADTLGNLDTSNVQGVADDLVIRPFARKGEFFSLRDFDKVAMQFHFGMQPLELFGVGVDADGDGVVNEILPGELSALHVFGATVERPVMEPLSAAASAGFARFSQIGCAACHVPALETESTVLRFRFPEVPADPSQNVYYEVDLTEGPGFSPNGEGGIVVPLFADLKRHDMGPGLAEDFHFGDGEFNRSFTTARLWGVADTAPYLHDGRATTLTEAILAHGGEAQAARDAFAALTPQGQTDLLALLRSLRTPEDPVADLLDEGDDEDDDEDDDYHIGLPDDEVESASPPAGPSHGNLSLSRR